MISQARSPEKQQEYYDRRNIGPREHVCITCKKKFMGLGDRSYCHDPCRYIDKRHTPLAEQTRYCIDCTLPFTPISSNQKRCHAPCRPPMQLRKLSIHFTGMPCNLKTVNIEPLTTDDKDKVTCRNCRKVLK